MADYDLKCVNCFHKSHEGKECPYCPMPTPQTPNSRCREFVRADLFVARSLARIEQFLAQTQGQSIMAMSAIFDLLQEAYPEAAVKLKANLEERQKAAEAEMELQRTMRLAEADQSLKAAKEAEERRATEELVKGYQEQSSNVIPFPSRPEVIEAEVVEDEGDDA